MFRAKNNFTHFSIFHHSMLVSQVLQKRKPKRAEMADSHVSGDKDIGSLFSLISNR
jgi:hypothetical protein